MSKIIINDDNIVFSICISLFIFAILLSIGKKRNIIIYSSSLFAIALYFVIFKTFKDGTTLNLVVAVRPDLMIRSFAPIIQKIVNFRPSKNWSIFGNMTYRSVWDSFMLKVKYEYLLSPMQVYFERMLYIASVLVKITCTILLLGSNKKHNHNFWLNNNVNIIKYNDKSLNYV